MKPLRRDSSRPAASPLPMLGRSALVANHHYALDNMATLVIVFAH
jgi:hypothetical protein